MFVVSQDNLGMKVSDQSQTLYDGFRDSLRRAKIMIAVRSGLVTITKASSADCAKVLKLIPQKDSETSKV